MRIIKSAGLLLVVFFVAVTVGPVAEQGVYAGGGINYKVTVSNPTDKKCQVWVMVEKLVAQYHKEDVVIQPGGSYTWQTGAVCPCGVKGKVWDPVGKEWRWMQCVNMYGHKSDCKTGLGNVAVCASASFTIVRKVGVTEVRDGDYGFNKN